MTGALERYRERLATLGVIRNAAGELDFSALFARGRRPLVWPLVDEEAVRDLTRRLTDRTGGIRPDDVLRRYAAEPERPFARWREELPFLDDGPLDRAIDGLVDDRCGSDLENGTIAGAAKNLSSFCDAQQRCLPRGLAVDGRLGLDGDGVYEFSGLVLPDALADRAGDLTGRVYRLGSAATVHRAYSLRIVNGIDLAVLGWDAEAGGGGR